MISYRCSGRILRDWNRRSFYEAGAAWKIIELIGHYAIETQEELAEKMQVSRQTISKWENARNYYEKMLLIDFLIHESVLLDEQHSFWIIVQVHFVCDFLHFLHLRRV